MESELYERWWKVINDEFGPVIKEEEEQEQTTAQPHPTTSNETTNTAQSNPGTQNQKSYDKILSHKEEQNFWTILV